MPTTTHAHPHAQVCVCAYTLTHARAYTHTHTHTHISGYQTYRDANAYKTETRWLILLPESRETLNTHMSVQQQVNRSTITYIQELKSFFESPTATDWVILATITRTFSIITKILQMICVLFGVVLWCWEKFLQMLPILLIYKICQNLSVTTDYLCL